MMRFAFFVSLLFGSSLARAAEPTDRPLAPVVKVVEGGQSQAKPEDCRATLVGPGINPPDPFPGYGGFVGWVSPIRLKDGDLVIGFSAGYWHASPPTPLRYSRETIAQYQKMGLPADVSAPRGGRAMIMRSSDDGKTWSKPVTMLDTPDDDRHPAFIELPEALCFARCLPTQALSRPTSPRTRSWLTAPSSSARSTTVRRGIRRSSDLRPLSSRTKPMGR